MKKDKKPYRILVIEDNPGDMVIVEDFLTEEILAPVIVQAHNFKEASRILLQDNTFNAILLDLSLPDKSGQDLVTGMLQITSAYCPIIILTGYTDIEFSIRSISQGILDYLIKDEMNASILYKSIIYAIERKKNISELEASEKRYSDLFELSPQPMCLYEMGTFRFLQVNKASIEHYGYSREEFLNMTLLDLVPQDEKLNTIRTIKGQKREINERYAGQSRNYKKNGEIIDVETFSTPLIINGKETTLVVAIDVTEKNQYENKITKAIIKTQEDERYEIGGELHDNVCQLLAASQMSFGLLKKTIVPPGKQWYEQGKEYINMALEEIRKLSHRLAPAFFDDSTLEQAFRRLFIDFNIDRPIEILLHFDKSMGHYTISRDIQLNLYRIMQEQLRNILKYAQASVIEVDVLVFNNKLKMKVTDNGVGFDVNMAKNGIGLANMKRRAGLFSGTFSVESSPGNGCTIMVDIPLESKNEIISAKTKTDLITDLTP